MLWTSILGGIGSASGSAGLQMGGNIGNKDVKKKSNRVLFNALDYGGGLSQTINMFSGGKLFGGDDEEGIEIELPAWWEDPLYQKTQDELYGSGLDILAGNLNDYYKGIGEYGGVDFENLMHLINRDTANAVNESLVKQGINRGGFAPNILSKTMADIGTKLRWEDYMKAMENRKWLMGTGLDTLTGVRSSALDKTNLVNTFNLNSARTQLGLDAINYAREQDANAAWSDSLSSIISTISNLYGAKQLGSATTTTPTTTQINPGYYQVNPIYSQPSSSGIDLF